LNLKGWVRNLRDGRVEAVFEGTEDAVDTMIAWCKTGPSLASVSDVKVIDEPVLGNLTDFTIRY
jgi:acylphosphatase